ncbi:uncharacterized protein LOC119103599 [Pollicipes pollicipes]|uniref:uncharacterized protein LOC119103599 n=1 Tax=Pollicipes pollicipes TaxID=41117 RepID=UPI0018859292|nr:uncharacterized protein LOC119103599 [Pollicipes pollicipes]
MKLQLLLVAACLCAVSDAWIPKKLLKKYAMKKIMGSCYGEELMAEVKREIKAACDKCHGEAGPELPQLRSQLASMFGAANVAQPVAYQHAVQYVPVPAPVRFQPVSYQYQRRWKRSHHGSITPEKLEMMRVKASSMVGNITCVMREMKMLDSNNQVDFVSIEKRIMALPVSKELMDDLKEGMERCRDFAACMPSQVFEKSPILAGFGKQMAFFKCFQMAKVESCMKQDFREDYYPMLLRSGLDMGEDESFQTIVTSMLLEEATNM